MFEAEETPASPGTSKESGDRPDGGVVQAYRAHAQEPRTVLFTMRMNPQDHARVKAVAVQRGVSMARLMQEVALSESYDRGDRVVMVAALDAANRLLANIAGNINQLAHHANMAQQLVAHAELETALGQVREVRDELTDVLRQIR
jgi:Bacterial mobilisation protein (MobC)